MATSSGSNDPRGSDPRGSQSSERSKGPLIALIVGAAVVLVIGLAVVGALVALLSGDAPEEASIESAVGAGGSATTLETGGESTDSVEGTWTVDASDSPVDFESASGSFVGFRIDEELSGIGSTTAVGRTAAVDGTLTIEGPSVTAVDVVADLTVLTTNESRRDAAARRAMGAETFPEATFSLTEPIEIGSVAAGVTVEADAVGDLTVNGQTQPVTIPLDAQLVDDRIVVVGSTTIQLADFGVAVPQVPVVVSAEDHATVELQLFFGR